MNLWNGYVRYAHVRVQQAEIFGLILTIINNTNQQQQPPPPHTKFSRAALPNIIYPNHSSPFPTKKKFLIQNDVVFDRRTKFR